MSAFDTIIGQELTVARLKRALGGDRFGHAYLFSGEKGSGKKTLAKAFAKALNCESRADNDACGQCLSCRVFESGNHPDTLYIARTKTAGIGVDDVREQIIRPMSMKPFRYRYKIFIVDEAETMTPAAQNALLKTIEEPAPYGVFIFLTTDTHAILPTVLSRCAAYKLKPLPDTLVAQVLKQRAVPEDSARLCAAFARGNIGRALALAESEELAELRGLAEEITKKMPRMNIVEALNFYPSFLKWKESVQTLLEMLYLCYHDAVLAQPAPSKAYFQGLEAITRAQKILRQNGNFQLTIEVLLLELLPIKEQQSI